MKKFYFLSVLFLALVLKAQNGSVGIGTLTPDPSAILDVTASDKGMLIPRVALKNETDVTTIANPSNGLFAFSNGKGGLKAGLYYFSVADAKWVKVYDQADGGLGNGEGTAGMGKGARYIGSGSQDPIACLALTCTPVAIKWNAEASQLGGTATAFDSYKTLENPNGMFSSGNPYELVIQEDGIYQISAVVTLFSIANISFFGANSQTQFFIKRNTSQYVGVVDSEVANHLLAKETVAFSFGTALSSVSASMSTTARLFRGDVISVGAGLSIANSGLDLTLGLLVPSITPDSQSLSIVKVGQ